MTAIDRTAILAARMQTQAFAPQCHGPEGYVKLFRKLQPVSPPAFAYPGSPPTLVGRTEFQEEPLVSRMRARREIVKGRFLGGTVGYVLAADLEDDANAFRRPITSPNSVQQDVLHAVRHAGPLTPRQLREETDYLSKEIGPALSRLQQAFLVYEDQVETDWERGWYDFESEWPDVDVDDERRSEAIAVVAQRFMDAMVFATMENLRDWSALRVKDVRQFLTEGERSGTLVPSDTPGLGRGWLSADALPLETCPIPSRVVMLPASDPIARAHRSEMKRRFAGLELLQYLLVDGYLTGAVCGHWRIGPHDVDDVVIQLPAAEYAARRDEILTAIRATYEPPNHHILRYCGQGLA